MISTLDNTMQYLTSLDRYFTTGDTSAAALAILFDLGFSVQCDGFTHLRMAIYRKYANPRLRCQDLYNAIVDDHPETITSEQIEQSIRSAINSAWNRTPGGQWELLFPSGNNGRRSRPTNFEFISRIACILELWNSCRETGPK